MRRDRSWVLTEEFFAMRIEGADAVGDREHGEWLRRLLQDLTNYRLR